MSKTKKIVSASNLLLAQELGRNPHGQGHYMWRFSEDWTRSKRAYAVGEDETLIPEFTYVANESTGLIEATPRYLTEKVCIGVTNQWVMSIWLKNEDFYEWRMKYGDTLEWPKHGDYWPVSHPSGVVGLDTGTLPTTDITWEFIRQVRKDKAEAKSFEEKFHALQAQKEKAEHQRLMDGIVPLLPVYDGIPGSRSFGIWPIATTKQDPRIEGNKIWTP